MEKGENDMGVYIPNMSKPKDCYLCEFTNGYECWSNGEPWFDVKEAYAKRTLSPNCPLIEIVTCGECKHKPIKYDPEGDEFGFNLVSPNGYDNLCPCLNTDDGFYSYMPDDNFFCAYGERRSDET